MSWTYGTTPRASSPASSSRRRPCQSVTYLFRMVVVRKHSRRMRSTRTPILRGYHHMYTTPSKQTNKQTKTKQSIETDASESISGMLRIYRPCPVATCHWSGCPVLKVSGSGGSGVPLSRLEIRPMDAIVCEKSQGNKSGQVHAAKTYTHSHTHSL